LENNDEKHCDHFEIFKMAGGDKFSNETPEGKKKRPELG